MFFHRPPTFVKHLYPSLTWSIPTNEKIIYLTFDDGPIPFLTEYILDTLIKLNVKATFFCVGDNLRKNNEIAKRAVEEGHQLANHTFNHVNGWKTNNDIYFDNIEQCEHQLHNLGQNNKLFRPPYGKIKRPQIKRVKKTHQIVMWDVLSGDYSQSITPKECLYNTIKSTKRGSIVLFHDNLKADKNVRYSLPRYIDHYLKKEYEFRLL